MFKEHLLSISITYFESTDNFIAFALDRAAYLSDVHWKSGFPTVLKVRIQSLHQVLIQDSSQGHLYTMCHMVRIRSSLDIQWLLLFCLTV